MDKLQARTSSSVVYLVGFAIFGLLVSELVMVLKGEDILLILLALPVIHASIVYSRRIQYIMVGMVAVLCFVVMSALYGGFVDVLVTLTAITVATIFVAETVRAQHELRLNSENESQARFRHVVDNLGEALIIVNTANVVQYANSRVAELCGFTSRELLGQPPTILIHDQVWQQVHSAAFTNSQHQSAQPLLTQLVRKDGSQFWAEVSVGALRNNSGEVTGLIVALADISQRHHAEEALATERDSLQTLMESLPDAVYYKDREGRYLKANSALARRLGLDSAHSIISKTDSDFHDAAQAEQIRLMEHQILQALQPSVNTNETRVNADGSETHFLVSKVPVRDQAGNAIGLVGISRDVTQQRRALAALRQSEEQLRSLIASIDDLIFLVDLEGRLLFYHQNSKASYHDTPITPNDVYVGKPYQIVLPAPLTTLLTDAIHSMKSTLATQQFDYQLNVDGQEQFYRARVSPLINSEIQMIGITVISSDITPVIQAAGRQKHLLELEHIHRMITERFLQSDDLDTILHESLREIGEYLDVASAFVFQFREGERQLDNTHTWKAPQIQASVDHLTAMSSETLTPTIFPQLLHDGMVVISENVPVNSEITAHFLAHGIRSVLMLPLYVNGKLQGFIGFSEGRRSRNWLPEEIVALRNISQSYARALERQKARVSLIQARDAAVRSARLKGEFMSNMSHEVRTPMTGVLGMLELLLETELDEMQIDFAQTAFSSAHNLLRILDDILDFSKIEAGKIVLEARPTDLRGIVEETCGTLLPRATQKGLALNTIIAPDIPSQVIVDQTRLRQILTNLVSNAIKFTHEGAVEIHVWQINGSDKRSKLRFEVRDTGIGIAPEQQAHIFESFVQADGSTTRKYGGTGLGLSISKQLVELMDGQIEVRSSVGKGSTFAFTLTLATPAESGSSSAETVPILTGNTLLLIEYDPTNRYTFAEQLRGWGAKVFAVSALDEARAILSSESVDGVLGPLEESPSALALMNEVRAQSTKAPAFIHVTTQLIPDVPPDHADAQVQRPLKAANIMAVLTKFAQGRSPGAEQVPNRDSPGDTALSPASTLQAPPKLLMVAVDSLINQTVIKRTFEGTGFATDFVTNLDAVLTQITQKAYDLVLVDLQGTQGCLDLANALANYEQREHRPDQSAPHLPIIALLASTSSEDRGPLLASGIAAVVSKPFSTEELRSAVEEILLSSQIRS